MKIVVVGLGKIGLPLAVQYATKGNDVAGVDIDKSTVELINSAVEPFPGEAHLQELLTEVVRSGNLRATTVYSDAVPQADVVVVVVPLYVDGSGVPDFTSMDSAMAVIAESLTADTLVICETTLPVGTTRSRWKPVLEAGSGLAEGSDFHVVFSPERVLTGRVFEDLRKYPKLIGGLSKKGADEAKDFYEAVLDFAARPDLERKNGVWDLGSAEASELAKLAETTFRDVNIGLANQFAVFAETAGIDVYQVIEACNSQPYSHIHQPGIAVGGHCIPVYPRLYLSNDPSATIVRAAREANEVMPTHAVDLLEAEYGDLSGAQVAVLGAAYRGGVKETALSGVFPTVNQLVIRGAIPVVHDPLYTHEELAELGFRAYAYGDHVDAAILHTDHAEYVSLRPQDLPGLRVLVDGRCMLEEASFPEARIVCIGRGGSPSESRDLA